MTAIVVDTSAILAIFDEAYAEHQRENLGEPAFVHRGQAGQRDRPGPLAVVFGGHESLAAMGAVGVVSADHAAAW